MSNNGERKWWKEGIVYQIYPRSFQDTNGDGIGDLQGIIDRLDYIQSLGTDIIWLNPVYSSPNDDNGYDISDYRNIMETFGSMKDMDKLMIEMKRRNLRLVMDLVVNHSSDEHKWFKESRKSRDNEYRDYYHWWPAEKGTPPKRFSYFDENNNAWKYDAPTDSYYLHYYSEKQPDLKWENPKVREEVYDIMKFWLDKGIDGFRMDVISTISKDTDYPELPPRYKGDFITYYADGPNLHDYLREMHREVLSKYDVMTVGEAPGITKDNALDFVDEDRRELNMFFHFDLMALDRAPGETFKMNDTPWKLTEFKKVFTAWDTVFAKKGWGSLYLDNHDFPRSVSRWGNDSPQHWRNSATLLHTFLLSMRGTPYFLYGEEIGMTNIKFDNIADYQDINTLSRYKNIKNNGGDLKNFIANEKNASRDNARTPMQWNSDFNAGFSEAEPWLRVNENFEEGISVAHQETDTNSVLNYFKTMVQVRKDYLGLVYGSYHLLLPDDEHIYAYLRTWEEERFLILLNFTTETSFVKIDEINYKQAHLIISNDVADVHKVNRKFELTPYQAVIYKVF